MMGKNLEEFKEALKAQYREQLRTKRLLEKSGIISIESYRKQELRLLKKASQVDGLDQKDFEEIIEQEEKKCA